MHACMHTHTFIHADVRTYIHTYMHSGRQKFLHAYIHTAGMSVLLPLLVSILVLFSSFRFIFPSRKQYPVRPIGHSSFLEGRLRGQSLTVQAPASAGQLHTRSGHLFAYCPSAHLFIVLI